MIRKAIRGHLSKNPALEKLLPYIVQYVGFIFTKEDLGDIRAKLLENRRGAPAKVGAIAPCDVKLSPHNTGTIEILNEVHLIKQGDKVLDMTTEELRKRFMAEVHNVAAVSLDINYPTMGSVAHSLARGMQNVLGIAAVTYVNFREAAQLKEYLADASKFIATSAPVAAAGPAAAALAAETNQGRVSTSNGTLTRDLGISIGLRKLLTNMEIKTAK
uniref:Large ribosomal subunit protein uL10 n=1 Tax=Haemonchus contortus TaxID=6289 RepID=A0A7I4YZW5_HAECO